MSGAPARNARPLVRTVLRQWWIVGLAVLIGVAAALAYVKHRSVTYQSTEILELTSTLAAAAASAAPLVATTSPDVVASAASLLHTSDARALGIAQDVSFVLGSTTSLVYVVATYASGASATRYAGAFGEAYISALQQNAQSNLAALQKELASLTSQIARLTDQQRTSPGPVVTDELTAASASYESVESQIVTLETAPVPASVYSEASTATRSQSSKTKVIGIAGLVGLLVGLGIALGRGRLDTRLRSGADVEGDAPLLTELPFQAKLDPRLNLVPVVDDRSSILADRVRELRTTLQSSLGRRKSTVVLITSPQPGDGKSFLVANLAASWALAGRPTVAVSTDLRRPRLDTLLGVPSAELGLSTLTTAPVENVTHPGLFDRQEPGSVNGAATIGEFRRVLAEQPSRESVRAALIATRVPGLWLMPTGPSVEVGPGDLLASMAMRYVIEVLREQFEFVVIDTPAVEAVSDAGALASIADGVIVLARANRTDRTLLRDTIRRLTNAGATIVGVVLNLTTNARSTGVGYYVADLRPTVVPGTAQVEVNN